MVISQAHRGSLGLTGLFSAKISSFRVEFITHPFSPNNPSIFFRTASSIFISGGHGLLNPSPASFRVASILDFVPIAISDIA